MIVPYQDNVLLELEPLPTSTASGLHIVDTSRKTKGHRTARVIASGPGYYSTATHQPSRLIPNETKPGDRVIVDSLAGQNWAANISAPRHQEAPKEFQELGGKQGEFRIVRESEILAVIEKGTA